MADFSPPPPASYPGYGAQAGYGMGGMGGGMMMGGQPPRQPAGGYGFVQQAPPSYANQAPRPP
eukprot:1482096-Pyramimonas_sp.AAC.1